MPGLRTAFFSILAHGKHIPPHRGAYNGVLRLHLGLKVPHSVSACRIRIANEVHHWHEGEVLVFDDSFQHEAWNDSNESRVVLFVDFARPLRHPWHWLNERLLDVGRFAPFLRDCNARQRRWATQFHVASTREEIQMKKTQEGGIGWGVLAWLVGIPLPIILGFYLLKSCTG